MKRKGFVLKRKIVGSPYRFLNVDSGFSSKQTFLKINPKTGRIKFPYKTLFCKKCDRTYFFMNKSDVFRKCSDKKCSGLLERIKK